MMENAKRNLHSLILLIHYFRILVEYFLLN